MGGEIGVLQKIHREYFSQYRFAEVGSDRQRAIIKLQRDGTALPARLTVSKLSLARIPIAD